MIDKPHAPACERNREPILGVLREVFADRRRVLEVGSGTGQHAVHFAAAMPWLVWQCTDREEHLAGIRAWLDEATLSNTPPPLALDVADDWTTTLALAHSQPHPAEIPGTRADGGRFDAAFSANTLHIMGWPEVEAFFARLDAALAGDATVVVYGPFNDGGDYSSDSNREFDGWLRARDPRSGIRDVEAVDALARGVGLQLDDDVAMPANNRCLVWRRGA
jgi:cyclopropane fatty-acyl-phospholipid synthase-like methyltransferase